MSLSFNQPKKRNSQNKAKVAQKSVHFDLEKNQTHVYKPGHYAPGKRKALSPYSRPKSAKVNKAVVTDQSPDIIPSSLSEQTMHDALAFLENYHERYQGYEVVKCISHEKGCYQITFFDPLNRAAYKNTLFEAELKECATKMQALREANLRPR